MFVTLKSCSPPNDGDFFCLIMSFGLPYRGSKNKLASRLADFIETGRTLYDVFCGGGAVTDYMMRAERYQRYVINDVNPLMPKALEMAFRGEFKTERRWISREDFFRLRDTDPYAAICFSFANGMREYAYSKDKEPIKRAFHYAICFGDFTEFKARFPDHADALEQALTPLTDLHERRMALRNVFANKNHHFSEVQMLESLERLERLANLESLERLERLKYFEAFSGDYRDLSFDDPQGVIYCDPPYLKGQKKYQSATNKKNFFDYDAFYDWCEKQTLPVYISENVMPEDRFVCIAEFKYMYKCNSAHNVPAVERLFRPKTQI